VAKKIKLKDTYRHRGLRLQLVKELKSKGIEDERILQAFMQVKRHYFLDPAFADWAYKDVAFPIDAGQTISQPYTVALQTDLLEVKKGDVILEVGTGSGFQACILAHMGAKVYTIERQRYLFEQTNNLLKEIGFAHIRTLYGDGYKGAQRFAPFDKIIITAGATSIPQALIDQLKPGGIMVIPVGDGDVKSMVRIRKGKDGRLTKETHGFCRFVPLLEGKTGKKPKAVNKYVNLD